MLSPNRKFGNRPPERALQNKRSSKKDDLLFCKYENKGFEGHRVFY